MEQIKKKMAQLKRTQEEAEERAKKAEDELAATNAQAQQVSCLGLSTLYPIDISVLSFHTLLKNWLLPICKILIWSILKNCRHTLLWKLRSD